MRALLHCSALRCIGCQSCGAHGTPCVPPVPQGFPDYHVLLAKPKLSTKRFAGNPNIKQRFQVGRGAWEG